MVVEMVEKEVEKMGYLVEREEEEGGEDGVVVVVVVGMEKEMEEKKVVVLVVEKGGDGGWRSGRPRQGPWGCCRFLSVGGCWKK